MLGQFFSGRKGAGPPFSTTATTNTLESATEESHTRHLLYPETNTLYHPDGQPYPLHGTPLNPGTGYDGPLPEIDLEFPRDCRIIIAQDEIMSMPKTILFDSKPGPPRAESPTQPNTRARAFAGAAGGNVGTAGPSFGGHHARRASLVTETTPRSPTISSFTRTRARGNSISSMPNIDEHAQAQAKASESMDVIKTCLDCMFGNTTMSYRGISNKLHIVPLDTRTTDINPLTSALSDATNSLGRADGLRKRSHLAKSFTPANIQTDLPRIEPNEALSRESRRRTIFITRLFSIAIPDEETDPSQAPTPTPQSSLGKTNGFPFPSTSAKASKSPLPPHARKTPMYAITIILQLPVASPPSAMRPPSRPGQGNKGPQISTSAPGHDSLASSLDSDRRAGWINIDSSFGVESMLSNSLHSDVDDRVDVIGQHWDVITRTLTSLQYVVREQILAQFKLTDATSPTPFAQLPRNQPSRYTGRDASIPPMRRGWRLPPNALAFDQTVRAAVEVAGNRVVSGMRIPRVVTGQGKWGVWREEARWLGRWAGRREENFFFFNLLTAFLGNHTEWLNLLGPKWHRKRHREQQKSSAGENLVIPNRTVIVSPDKMAARRLIFLLAAFLPSTTSALYDGASPMRPSTSASLRAYSQSPPTNQPPSRKQSLRRQINRRPRGKQSLTNMRLQSSGNAAASSSTLESLHTRPDADVINPQEANTHTRRSSAHSIHASLVLPSMSDSVTTKSSVATTSTVTPQSTVPVAHFTLPRTTASVPSPDIRPESSDSLASANLMHTLQRSGTGSGSTPSTDSGNTSRWSGFMSFWGGGRRASTDQSDVFQTTDDGVGLGVTYKPGERPTSQLEKMVQELTLNQGIFGETDDFDVATTDNSTTVENSPETYAVGGSSGVPPSAARPIPERPKQFDHALKLSVNEKDGVIDVDIPLPDFGSPLQSPLLGGYGSTSSQHGSSFGESSVLSMPSCEPDQPVNAAGWLKQFHADFAVQAIKPYADLERDIKRAMSAEPTPITSAPTPTLEQGPLERWIEVCSALVADTRTFSIKRLRLRRLVKLIPTPVYQQSALTPGISGVPSRSQYGNPYTSGSIAAIMTEQHLEERFTEEPIMDFDATLIDAVDRVLAQSGHGSRVHSASSSRSSSRRGRRDTRAGSDAGHHHHQHHSQQHMDTPQTDAKGIIFDALESVVKNVTAERNIKDEPKDNLNGDRITRTATDSSLKEGIRRWLAEVE